MTLAESVGHRRTLPEPHDTEVAALDQRHRTAQRP
ncbi:hypothetical protein MSMEI_4825 [Mycolicibacterium smegmatis MC2 155]|uniref:Uncharacterized protein n=1 Tax=Mycolicibacterium smegmatis (strain ATCC 700084 / mc(2)155) TaxID=246196 RepID=I7FIS7_MYCS2|nr:hypothetical protein MSMEI_4825 [Mycolicibacterium smegmatis MC2 155]